MKKVILRLEENGCREEERFAEFGDHIIARLLFDFLANSLQLFAVLIGRKE